MSVKLIGGLALAVASVSASIGSAATLYSDNFNTDTSATYSVKAGPGTNPVTFAFDYSTYGIPAAPGSSDTRGLKMEANTTTPPTGTTITGVSAVPIGQSFTGNYKMSFQAWLNTVGPFPAGGSGSTQLSTWGIGAGETNSNRPGGTIDGLLFGATGDGGSGDDYRAYGPGNSGAQLAITTGVYAASPTGTGTTARNNSDAYYASFGAHTPPAAQTTLFPGTQTGSTAAGTIAFSWQLVEVTKIGNVVTYDIGGKRIATVDLAALGLTLTGSSVVLGQSDINGTNSTNTQGLIFGLYDNLVVTDVVPEPTSLSALALGGLLLRRRK